MIHKQIGMMSSVDSSVSGNGIVVPKVLQGVLLLRMLYIFLDGLDVKTNVDIQKVMLAGNVICKNLSRTSVVLSCKGYTTEHILPILVTRLCFNSCIFGWYCWCDLRGIFHIFKKNHALLLKGNESSIYIWNRSHSATSLLEKCSFTFCKLFKWEKVL